MKSAQELEKMFDVDLDRIVEIDEDASRGVLQGDAGETVTGPEEAKEERAK